MEHHRIHIRAELTFLSAVQYSPLKTQKKRAGTFPHVCLSTVLTAAVARPEDFVVVKEPRKLLRPFVAVLRPSQTLQQLFYCVCLLFFRKPFKGNNSPTAKISFCFFEAVLTEPPLICILLEAVKQNRL